MRFIKSPQTLILLCFSLLLWCECGKQKSKYPNYSENKSGLFYHRITIGEGKDYPADGDFLTLHLRFKSMANIEIPFALFKNELGWDTLHFYKSKCKHTFYEALSMLSEGDSCSFIFNRNNAFDTSEFSGIATAFQKDSLFQLDVKLIQLKTASQQSEEQLAYDAQCRILAVEEQNNLKHYLDSSKSNFPKEADENGLYFLIQKRGSGKAVKAGDNLTIRYCGKFLDGQIFDNSTYEKEALNFTLGEPGQVIRGIELALYKMHEGDIVQILVPSSLAFGSKGSAGGIVSPFKTVTFALEILKIN